MMPPAAVPDFSKWKMNHTMIRVKDPVRSIAFYQKLGFSMIEKLPQPEHKFDLYFLGFGVSPASKRGDEELRSDRQGLLELTHNHGTEDDETYTVSNGNEEPYLGLQHLGITVRDLDAVTDKLDGNSVAWHASPKDERNLTMRSSHTGPVLCKDPDGYYIELHGKACKSAANADSFNFTGLRIKDPHVSLQWYSGILHMKLLQQVEGDGITSYWLGYSEERSGRILAESAEGIVKLIWIHGSEKSQDRVYHNGNSQPQGFGHLAVSVDDIVAACEYFEAQGVKWRKRLTEGRLKSIAFVLDPDEYWIEIIQNARIREPLGVQ